MSSKIIYPRFLILITALGLVSGLGSVSAGTLSLSTVPLATATSVDPNVFFLLDDSGSMDWEVLTKSHWTWKAYNPDETVIGSTFKSTDGGSNVTDGSWTSNYHSGSSYPSTSPNYVFNASDNLYDGGAGCGDSNSNSVIGCGALTYAANLPYQLDWRILSSSLNTTYFDPSATYTPWEGPCMSAGTWCANASFTAARSNPREGESGYTATRNLTGFVYEVWVDDKGFSGARPHRGTIVNMTTGANGIVDLWDKHIQYTVNSASVTVVTTTYAPTSAGMNPTTSSSTISDATQVAAIQQNVANWYQYYRRRSLTAKAAISQVMSEFTGFRYGLTVINGSGTLFQQVPPAGTTSYSASNTTLLTNLYNYNWPADGTPLRSGLKIAGDYFKGALAGKTNPIIDACQKCYTILLTDGYWNESISSGSTPAYQDVDHDNHHPTLADVARYYYITDLSATYANTVKADAFDTATWQHMVTYTVAFGLQGNLVDSDGNGWPNPALAENGNWGNPTACSDDCPEKLDDLWHAAYNAKGTFVSATNPAQLAAAMHNALQDIDNRNASMSAISLDTGSISTLTMLYQAQFNGASWQGFLYAHAVADGAVGDVVWEAGALLPSAASRSILTSNGTTGIPFQWASLTAAQQTALNKNIGGVADGLGTLRLDYLRGDGSKEVNLGCSGCVFRNRVTKLGDIISSSPQYVSNENFRYADNLESAAYSTYLSATKSTRTKMVYVGANDGMLHGFDATTGIEKLAYVPSSVFSKLSNLTSPSYSHLNYVEGTPTIGDAFYGGVWHNVLVGGLNGGGQAIYALDITDPSQFSEGHASSLVLWEFTDTNDADLGYTFSRPNIVKMANGTWAAVFGNGYNNTVADGHVSATGAAVLYIVNLQTGALIKKISTGVGSAQDPTGAARPNGLATVTPVDVNQDGVTDYVYAGDLFGNLWKFDVTATSSSSWDVAFHSGGTAAPLFKACGGTTCNSTNVQSITSRATVGFGPNKVGYMVYFGTGKYLESTDLSDVSKQTLYGIWDKNDGATTVSGRSVLLQQTILYEGSYTLYGTDGTDGIAYSSPLRVSSSNHYSSSPPPNTQLGWYLDLTSPVSGAQGERFVNQPLLRNGRVIFITTIPAPSSCIGGGDSWLMELDALDGALLPESPFDLNSDGYFNSEEHAFVGGQWRVVSGVKYANELLTTPAVASESNAPSKETKYMSGSSGAITTIDENPGSNGSGRDSWRQIK